MRFWRQYIPFYYLKRKEKIEEEWEHYLNDEESIRVAEIIKKKRREAVIWLVCSSILILCLPFVAIGITIGLKVNEEPDISSGQASHSPETPSQTPESESILPVEIITDTTTCPDTIEFYAENEIQDSLHVLEAESSSPLKKIIKGKKGHNSIPPKESPRRLDKPVPISMKPIQFLPQDSLLVRESVEVESVWVQATEEIPLLASPSPKPPVQLEKSNRKNVPLKSPRGN